MEECSLRLRRSFPRSTRNPGRSNRNRNFVTDQDRKNTSYPYVVQVYKRVPTCKTVGWLFAVVAGILIPVRR
jgi:hypothetical protein